MQRAFSFREDAILDAPIKHPPRVTSLALEHALVEVRVVFSELAQSVGVCVAHGAGARRTIVYIVNSYRPVSFVLRSPIYGIQRTLVIAAKVLDCRAGATKCDRSHFSSPEDPYPPRATRRFLVGPFKHVGMLLCARLGLSALAPFLYPSGVLAGRLGGLWRLLLDL